MITNVTFEWIVEEYRVRREAMDDLFHYMREAKNHFNGDVVIPLPEMDRDEKPAVANLMSQGLDQTAMRVASVLPNLHYPAMVPGRDVGEGSEDWARRRRMANAMWWEESKLNLKLRRMARWVVGYATAPMMVRPNFTKGIPEFVLRDPLSTYPCLNVNYDDEQPYDFIYAYKRTFGWLEVNHPDAADKLAAKQGGRRPAKNTMVELVEYISPYERVLGVLSMRPSQMNSELWKPVEWETAYGGGCEIARAPNRAEVCWGVNAQRITIDRLVGQFNQVFGIYQNQAKLMALESIAVEKAIFPDIVIQGTTPGRTPILVNGAWADGRSGDINLVRDGNVDVVQLNPGFMTQPLIDRHERNIRQAGVPAQFSGESPSNIATGRMGDQTLSATVDFPIQEYQEIVASTLWEANKRAIAVAKGYFGTEKKSFYVSFAGNTGSNEYKPNTHFETDAHRVIYSAPGADVNSLVIGIGQRVGIGTMSHWTAMQQDPLIPDAEFEYKKVTSEKIARALTDFVATKVVEGVLDPLDVILLVEEVEKGASIGEAWKKAQEAAQKRQAEEAAKQQAATAAAPDPALAGMDPSMQPGLSAPPALEDPAGTAIAGPNPSQENLTQLLGALRQPAALTGPMGAATPPMLGTG